MATCLVEWNKLDKIRARKETKTQHLDSVHLLISDDNIYIYIYIYRYIYIDR